MPDAAAHVWTRAAGLARDHLGALAKIAATTEGPGSGTDEDPAAGSVSVGLEAAIEALTTRSAIDPGSVAGKAARWHAAVALAAAEPLIRADEQERIALLAEDRDAIAWNAPLDANECSRVPFADLIRGDQP